MRIPSLASVLVSILVLSGCGGGEPPAGAGPASPRDATGSAGVAGASSAFAGSFTGQLTIAHGGLTWTAPVQVDVTANGDGSVRIPLREVCFSVDHVDVAPPDALAIALAPAGEASFHLPTGEPVRLESIRVHFSADGRSLEVRPSGVVEGEALEWIFIGVR